MLIDERLRLLGQHQGLSQLFYDCKSASDTVTAKRTRQGFGSSVRDSRTLESFRKAISELTSQDRRLLFELAQKMIRERRNAKKKLTGKRPGVPKHRDKR